MRGATVAKKCRATITDLSEGGMAVKTDMDFEEGMMLHLRLNSPPGKYPMQIRGEVRSVRGPSGGLRHYGVRFHKIGYFPTN